MSGKFLWLGLTFIQVVNILKWDARLLWVGAVSMVVGAVLLLLDK